MRGRWMLATLAAALTAQATTVVAQPRPGGSPRDAVNGRFESAAPAVGEPMPDVAVYGADGEQLRLKALLRGHYTVLVLGCLT